MTTKAALSLRKQPRQKRAHATLDFILEGAAQVLERDGTAGYTTNGVAERAGVSIGTLYQYFPNKTALLAALTARSLQRLAKALALAVDESRNRPLNDAVGHMSPPLFIINTRARRWSVFWI
jgi:AcrR family transcriptional regulator